MWVHCSQAQSRSIGSNRIHPQTTVARVTQRRITYCSLPAVGKNPNTHCLPFSFLFLLYSFNLSRCSSPTLSLVLPRTAFLRRLGFVTTLPLFLLSISEWVFLKRRARFFSSSPSQWVFLKRRQRIFFLAGDEQLLASDLLIFPTSMQTKVKWLTQLFFNLFTTLPLFFWSNDIAIEKAPKQPCFILAAIMIKNCFSHVFLICICRVDDFGFHFPTSDFLAEPHCLAKVADKLYLVLLLDIVGNFTLMNTDIYLPFTNARR